MSTNPSRPGSVDKPKSWPSAIDHAPDLLAFVSGRYCKNADPQATLEQVVGFVIGDNQYSTKDLLMALRLLLVAGARIATLEPSCALSALATAPNRPSPEFFHALAPFLFSRPGQYPCHALARHGLLPLPANTMDLKSVHAAFRQRDPSGRTVSHYLWDERSPVARHARHDRQSDDPAMTLVQSYNHTRTWRLTMTSTWTIQSTLNAIGAGMLEQDDNGVSAMDLCLQRIRAGDTVLDPDMPVCQAIAAFQRKRDMEQSTPIAPTKPPSPRL